MKFSYIASFCLIFLISSCSLITDEYQVNQKKVLNYLLEAFPIPEKAEIIKAPTVLLGTGGAVSGRITLSSNDSPAENLIFYGEAATSAGWNLVSTKAGEEVTLVYNKNGRVATIYITPKNTFRGFFQGDVGSDIDVTLMHPDVKASSQFGGVILPEG